MTVSGTATTEGTTGAAIKVQIASANNAGNVLVNRTGAITAGTVGINATTAGTGTVTVNNSPATAATLSFGTVGIDAQGFNSASGLVSVTTGANLTLSGTNGTGINATNAGTAGVTVVSNGGIGMTGGTGIFAQSTGASGAVAVTVGGSITGATTGVSIAGGIGNTLTVQSTGSISGTIGLSLNSAATTTTLDLQGSLSGTGGTAINIISGNLGIGGSGAFGTLTGSIADAGTLTFNRSDTITLSNAITGTGDVQQIGTGTTVLSGTNSYIGPTTINAGTLLVNGSITSAATVNSGGTLGGIGTIGNNVTVNSGGTLAPGSGAPGTSLTIGGSVAFNAGAIYQVQVNPSTASSATVGGSATLTGASVHTVFAAGSYVAKSYDILHATAGFGGTTFTGVSGNVPGFQETLSYTATNVFLNLTGQVGIGGGLNQNQQNVANALNNFFNGGGALPPNFLNVFGLTGGNLANALTQRSGEAATGAQQSAVQLMNDFLGVMLDPFVNGGGLVGAPGGSARAFASESTALPDDVALAYAQAFKAPAYKAPPVIEQRWAVWVAGYGGQNNTHGDAMIGSHDLTARAGGGAAGADYHLTRDTVLGFALAGAGTDWSLAQGLGGGHGDAFQAGLYGATRSGPWYLAGALAFANHWMSTDRASAFGDNLSAKFDAQSVGGRLEGGYRFATAFGGIAPYAAVQAQSFRTPTYSETDLSGGGFGLTFNGRTASPSRGEFGTRLDTPTMLDADTVLKLRGRLAWAHDWVSDPSLMAVFQALPGASFVVNGARPRHNSALVTFGPEVTWRNGWSLMAKFDGEFASGEQTYTGTARLRYAW